MFPYTRLLPGLDHGDRVGEDERHQPRRGGGHQVIPGDQLVVRIPILHPRFDRLENKTGFT